MTIEDIIAYVQTKVVNPNFLREMLNTLVEEAQEDEPVEETVDAPAENDPPTEDQQN